MMISGLVVLTLLFPVQEQEWPYLQEAPRKIKSQIEKAIQKRDLNQLFTLHELARKKYPTDLLRDPSDKSRYHSLLHYLRAQIRSIPEARKTFRNRHGKDARDTFHRAGKNRDLSALEKAVDQYFLAEGITEAFDEMANYRFAEGRLKLAANIWERALEFCPPEDRLHPVLIARLATTYHLLKNGAELARIKTMGSEKRILVGGRVQSLSDFLAPLKIKTPPPLPETSPTSLQTEPRSPSGKICLGRLRLLADGPTAPQTITTRILELPDRTILFSNTGRRVHALQPFLGNGTSLQNAIYWRFPESVPISARSQTRPIQGSVIGCTPSMEGKVYVTLLSKSAAKRAPRSTSLYGPTRLVALDARTGRSLWDTADTPFKPGDREFVFASDPVLWNDRIYLTAMTGSIAQREAYLVAFDSKTGRLLWRRFLAAGKPLKNHSTMIFPTFVLRKGWIYVSTNVGAVMALHTENGIPLWARTYPSTIPGFVPHSNRTLLQRNFRAPSPPILIGNRLYILAQDHKALLSFERTSGNPIALRWENERVNWDDISRMTATRQNWIVLGGRKSWMLRTSTSTLYPLYGLNARGLPGGQIRNEQLLLPFHSEGSVGLTLFDGKHEWKKTGQILFPGKTSLFSFDFRGPCLATVEGSEQGRRVIPSLAVYTSLAHIQNRYRPKVDAIPPDPEGTLRFAKLLRVNRLWKEAAEAYRKFFSVAEGNPRWAKEIQDARWWMKTVGKED